MLQYSGIHTVCTGALVVGFCRTFCLLLQGLKKCRWATLKLKAAHIVLSVVSYVEILYCEYYGRISNFPLIDNLTTDNRTESW
jgi:glucan phosphoethanolaminetransferase (alkaline phosphatase superfamily)